MSRQQVWQVWLEIRLAKTRAVQNGRIFSMWCGKCGLRAQKINFSFCPSFYNPLVLSLCAHASHTCHRSRLAKLRGLIRSGAALRRRCEQLLALALLACRQRGHFAAIPQAHLFLGVPR